jgi:Repeat of unknown function (DUF346)
LLSYIPEFSIEKMTAWSANRLNLFVIGVDSAIYHKYYNGASWAANNWESLGGTFLYEPAAVAWGPNHLDVFAIGMDSALYHKYWDSSKWMPSMMTWDKLGGISHEKPTIVSWAPN